MSLTVHRRKDWVFRAFWTACATSSAPKCAVRIPLTCIFENGVPHMVMGSDSSGCVKIVSLDNVDVERSMGDNGFRGKSMRHIRALRKLLIDYSEDHGYGTLQLGNNRIPLICMVIYLDGKTEDLALNVLDNLLRNEVWTKQVLIIQSYVPTVSVQTGVYSSTKKVRSLVTSNANEAADMFATAIARYAEEAYRGASDLTGGVRAPLKVTDMECKFALDPSDNIVFLYSEYTAVEMQAGRIEVEEAMAQEERGRVASAAQSVARVLLENFTYGSQKYGDEGVKACFDFFDPQGKGYFDADQLIDGLARLSIGVTYAVGAEVLEIIGGIGSQIVTMDEFKQFLLKPLDLRVFDAAAAKGLEGARLKRKTSPTSPSSSAMAGGKRLGSSLEAGSSVLSAGPTLHKSGKAGGKVAGKSGISKVSASAETKSSERKTAQDLAREQLLPPQKESTFRTDFMDMRASQESVAGLSGNPDAGGAQEVKEVASVAAEGVAKELPLPEGMYSTKGPQQRAGRGNRLSKRNQRVLDSIQKKVRTLKGNTGTLSLSASLSNLAGDSQTERMAEAGNDGAPRSAEGGRRTCKSARTGKTPERSPPGTAAAGVKGSRVQLEPLNLVGMVQARLEDLAGERDELLHLDHGVIMTYRVLDGRGRPADERRTHEKTDALRYRSVLEVRERNFAKAQEGPGAGEHPPDAQGRGSQPTPGGTAAQEGALPSGLDSAFTLVLVPDIFMTLDTLQAAFESLLLKYPYAQIVLVGLPGLPNTVWPRGWVLNSDLHARAMAKLLLHLQSTGKLAFGDCDPSAAARVPLFFMSMGSSSVPLSRFVSLFLPSLPELQARARIVCMVNGLLMLNNPYRSRCRSIRDGMLSRTSDSEVNELIFSLHFGKAFESAHDRSEVLERFWESRRGLQQMDGPSGEAFYGVLELLRGAALPGDAFDGAAMLLETEVPVMVIQSIDDMFVDPKNAAVYQAEEIRAARREVTDVVDCLDPRALNIAWLDAGHELVQEKPHFLLGRICKIAELCGIHPTAPPSSTAAAPPMQRSASVLKSEVDDLFDVLDMAARAEDRHDGEGRGDSSAGGMEAKYQDGHLSEAERKEQARLSKEAERERAHLAREEEKRLAAERLAEEERLATEVALREEAERVAQRERKEADRRNKAKSALDSKSRDLKQAREHQTEQLRKMEQAHKDHRNEARENAKMGKEDQRSRFAEEYRIECQIAERSRELAKARAEELAVLRREEAIKRVEENMARQRAARIEERRARAQQLVDNIRREELVLSGEKEGGYGMPADRSDVQVVIETSQRIMRDLLECRQRSIEALKRQKMVQEKTELFRKQLATVENDERRLRRAIRLVELNPAIIGEEMNAESQLAELRRNLATKQETLEELTALAMQREQQLDAANNSAQMLKVATQERDKLMQGRVTELHQFETNLGNQIGAMKMEKERQIIARDRLRIQVIGHQKRVDVVSRELIRVKTEKGKFIDTDVYVEGVPMRCDRKELKKHLAREMDKAVAQRDEVLGQLNTIRTELFELMERMAKAKRDLSKITGVTKVLFKTYRKFNSVSIAEIMHSIDLRQRAADGLEKRREKENDLEKEFVRAGSSSLVDRVRLKESDIRTKDERQFVGIDLVMNPEAYMHLSVTEAEQMQFDEDYHCSLSKTDLERIAKLPEQVSLALPFLYTAAEVNAHRLINAFIREKNEVYFQNRDFMGPLPGLGGVESVAGTDDASRSSLEDMSFMLSHGGVNSVVIRNSEVMHEILVREILRDRLRAAGAGDFLTEDEQRWLAMDRVLSPHVYDSTELDAPLPPPRVRTVDNTLNTSINKKPSTKGPRTEKEKLDLLRADFEGGKDLFGQGWKCPFTREQLLRIRKQPLDRLQGSEEVYVRSLMDKYYVDERESTLGHSTLKMIERMTARAAKILTSAEDSAVKELLQLKEAFANEPDDAVTVMSGQSFASASQASYMKPRGAGPPSVRSHASFVEVGAGEGIARVWGSWNEVHPASAGKESQISYFQLATFDASRDHPACFAIRPDDPAGEDLSDDEDATDAAVLGQGGGAGALQDEDDLYSSLFGATAGKAKFNQKNDPHSNYFIAESITELAGCDPAKLRGKVVLMQQKEPMTLFKVDSATLQGRQSRSHYFTLPSRESVRALDITVSIIFKGDFAGKGYRLGRLAAGLFRLPPETPTSKYHGKSSNASTASAPPVPEAVGYAPYHLQSPNLPDAMGRIVLVHRPRVRPLAPGTFQIVVGAASNTKYSIEVSCAVGKTALPIVDEAVTQARQAQSRLPTCLVEIESIEESIRLAERKLLVCEKMVREAELESERSQKGMRLITKKLERDDEDLALMEDERRDLQRELSIFEIEYTQWAATFATRNREKDDIKDGVRMMYAFKRDKIKEKEELKKRLEDARRDLPACIVILRNTAEAVHVAMSLNTIVQGVTEEATAATVGDFGGIQVSTPAEDVRRHLKQYGMKALTLEEQQWCALDQALNPGKYEWMREQEERERAEREAMGKKPKEMKYNPALEDFRLSKVEIEYILDTPFSMLSRREVVIRKLLTKYHDDKEALQKAIAAVAYSFDPHLAERTRAKNPKAYSAEEQRWSTVDRVLHPEIWAFYVNRQQNWLDRHEKDADNANAKQHRRHKKAHHKPGHESVTSGGASTETGSPSKGQTDSQTEGQDGDGDGEGESPGRLRTLSEDVLGELHQSLGRDGTGGALLQSRQGKLRAAAQASAANGNTSLRSWACPFRKDEIMRIWRTPRHFLKSDDEKEVYKLLQKYNGTYSSYMDQIAHAKRRQGHFVKEGAHIQWEKLGKLVSKDVDFRARQLLREIDRATFTKNEWISSDVLHANDQKFPTKVLRMHLEEALDTLLAEQIRDRERAEKIRVDSSDSEDEGDAALLLQLEQDDDVSLTDSDGGGGGGGGGGAADAEVLSKVRKRAERREKRKRKLKKINAEQEVLKVKKVLARKKTGVALAEAILQNQLGVGGCLACRTKKCRWRPSVDVDVCLARKQVLDEELERVRLDRDSLIFESDVVLSVQLGGNRVFKRQDLVDELMHEQRELAQRIDLNNVDQELHDAYATRKEYFESRYLHGYSLLLWTNNARQALEMRQSRLCALSVAKEVVDDILDWMLEGWYFGERESQFKVLGHVPSVKAQGKIRPGQDQISSVTQVVAKMKERAENRRKGIITATAAQGEMVEKAWKVEQDSQHKLRELKVAREGNEHEHMLNETETTLKFGIFMLTLMYFRAMTFLKREQKSWAGEGEEVGVKGKKGRNDKVMTDERMRMLDEENRAAARKKKVDIVLARCKVGEARRAEREAAERREAILRLQAVVRRQRLEQESISLIQKVYRGHLGRKAAKRWALKRAELGAMNALLNSTAIAIQRVWRGYEGRLFAVQKRTEMAQFIALMRVQESQQDEEIYWQTHPWSRFKRNRKEWLRSQLEKYRPSGTLGGSRLSAEEQAKLEGRTLEEIRRQIAGLDALEEEEDVDGAETSTAAGYSAFEEPLV